jgi:exo-1,4-beta-D-glucosaminidase
MRRVGVVLALAGMLSATGIAGAHPAAAQTMAVSGRTVARLALHAAWRIQSSAVVQASGAEISRPGYAPAGWFPASVPGTVLANLQTDGVYHDLYAGRRLADVPHARFEVPWWYRRVFTISAAPVGTHTFLHLDGVNYRGRVWVNGREVATGRRVVGTFRRFDLDVTSAVHPGRNAVAIRVDPVRAGDLTITWIDWNPKSPDRGMGLWQPVFITRSGPVSLRDPFVRTHLAVPGLTTADLAVSVTARNDGAGPVDTVVRGRIGTSRSPARYRSPPVRAGGWSSSPLRSRSSASCIRGCGGRTAWARNRSIGYSWARPWATGDRTSPPRDSACDP